MKDIWRLRARALETARRQVRAGHPEGVHDLRVALRRTSATASALGEKEIAKRAKQLVRSLSDARQLEVDRLMLTRVASQGLLSPEVAAGVDARWEGLSRKFTRKATRVAAGRALQSLTRDLSRRPPAQPARAVPKLERARRQAEGKLEPPPPDASDQDLHRFRLAVKRARYVAEDLAAVGAAGFERKIEREKALQEALGRWNDVRMFREHLDELRKDAELRGAVTLVAELERVIATLEGTETSARGQAIRAARSGSRVVPMTSRSA
jgi:CHAD domain-containing protein